MIQFTQDLLCGVFIVDEQHKILCNLINELKNNIEKKVVDNDNLIQELKHYTSYHFTTEAAFWGENTQEEINRHQDLHRNYIEYLNKAISIKNDSELFLEFVGNLEKFIIEHIKEEDKIMLRYVSHFNNDENE